jgi:transposase-like protein
MTNASISLVVCPICGQVNVCAQGVTTCICPVCQSNSDLLDEITIELVG